MKKAKQRRRRCAAASVLLCVLLLAATLCSCGNTIEIGEDEPLYTNSVALIEAIVASDRQKALDILHADNEETLYDTARSVLGDSTAVESIEINVAEGGTMDGREFRAVEFIVKTNCDSYYIESMVYTDDLSHIPNFDVERIPVQVENIGAQTVFVILGCISVGFAVWMLVDCAVKCKEKKWLWLILIAVGMFSVGISSTTVSGGMTVNFGWTHLSAIRFWDDGSFEACLMIPVGAVAWLALRNKPGVMTAEPKNNEHRSIHDEDE